MERTEMNQPILEIKNLSAGVEGKQILKGVNLTINAGEVHAVMGPNGSGKSTLAAVLAGRDGYDVTGGEVLYYGKDLLDLDPEERAREGVFLAFQYPVEIPGVNSTYFLKAALNEIRKHRGQPELDAMEFLALVKDKMKLLELKDDLLKRSVNEGFSGGEKKRNEIFQMAVLEPKLAILDETDSGLDIDALKVVTNGVNKLKRAGQRPTRHHALSAAVEFHRARFRPCARGWPHRENRRQRTRARTGSKGLRQKELIRLAQEQGHLSYDDINDALPDNIVTPEDLDEIYTKLRNLDIEIVDQAEVDRVKQPEPEEEGGQGAPGHSGRSGPHVSQANGPGAAADPRTGSGNLQTHRGRRKRSQTHHLQLSVSPARNTLPWLKN